MNINNINVNKSPISQLFDPTQNMIFEIPKYQREYTWGVREWESLFDDLTENNEGYFLGSIICINASTNSFALRKYEVIDGQQRLTTISLLLAALYVTLKNYKEDLDEEQVSDMLQLKRRLILKNTTDEIRVVPQIQGDNRSDYLGLMAKIGIISKREYPKNAGNRRIAKAYNYFKKRIEAILENTEDKLNVLFNIIDKINSAIIVTIEVSNHADAYTLFESLNNRGAPLTAVDLIKNLLLARLDTKGDGDIDYYFYRWVEIISNLGNEYANQERFFRQNYNAFRKFYNAPFVKGDIQYPLGSIAVRSTILDIYEKIISHDPTKFLDELSEKAEIYGKLLLNKPDDLSDEQIEYFSNIQHVQAASAYLFIMYLIKQQKALNINDDDINKICKLLVSFFVRRNVTDLPPTRHLNSIFMSFIETIEENNYQKDEIYDNLRKTLIDVSASDAVFEEKLRGPIYDYNSDATRFILCMIAKRGMTRETEIDLWKKTNDNKYIWTIEHIFPQGPNIPKDWVKMIADGDIEKAKEYQELYVHTLGNLTVTGYNSALGNKSFEEKKRRTNASGNAIGYLNNLNLNDDIRDKEKWTVKDIQERTDRMVKIILEMFRL